MTSALAGLALLLAAASGLVASDARAQTNPCAENSNICALVGKCVAAGWTTQELVPNTAYTCEIRIANQSEGNQDRTDPSCYISNTAHTPQCTSVFNLDGDKTFPQFMQSLDGADLVTPGADNRRRFVFNCPGAASPLNQNGETMCGCPNGQTAITGSGPAAGLCVNDDIRNLAQDCSDGNWRVTREGDNPGLLYCHIPARDETSGAENNRCSFGSPGVTASVIACSDIFYFGDGRLFSDADGDLTSPFVYNCGAGKVPRTLNLNGRRACLSAGSCRQRCTVAPMFRLNPGAGGTLSAEWAGTGDTVPSGTTVTFTAGPDDGYYVSGWSGCLSQNIGNHGDGGDKQCVATLSNTDLAVGATFADIDECAPANIAQAGCGANQICVEHDTPGMAPSCDDCENGGTPNSGMKTCACVNDWGGDTCETPERECENGGTRDDTTNTCTCVNDWGGDTCETPERVCANGGTRDDGTNTCTCVNDWGGDTCEDPERDCNTGTRDDGTNTCDCAGTGFEGTTCEDDIDECTEGTDNCHDVAGCTDTEGSFSCECPNGYNGNGVLQSDGGTGCTPDPNDECVPTNPCGANTVCNDPNPVATNTGDYVCSCGDGFSGTTTTGSPATCTDINECETGTASCGDEEKCVNTPGSFECEGLPKVRMIAPAGELFEAAPGTGCNIWKWTESCENVDATESDCTPDGEGMVTVGVVFDCGN